MALSAVAPRVIPRRDVIVAFVRIQESVTQPLVVRMLHVMERSQEILVVVGHAILIANVGR